MERFQINLYVNDKLVSDYSFETARMLVETGEYPMLIIFSGTNVVYIEKGPTLSRHFDTGPQTIHGR